MTLTISFDSIVLESASEIFETMMFMSIEQNAEEQFVIDGDQLLGNITFRGEAIQGMLAINSAVENCKTIACSMLGMDPDENLTEAEVKDALGEVCNMVMGSVKSRIIDITGDIQVSIPTVVSGQSLQSSLGEDAQQIDVECIIDEMFPIKFTLLYKNVG